MESAGRGRGRGTRPEVETPISKYLANLERRHSHYMTPMGGLDVSGEDDVPQTRPKVGQFSTKLNFDDTYFQDASMIHLSPPTGSRSTKRRRSSFFGPWQDDNEEVEALKKKNSDLERLLRETQADLINTRASQSKLEHVNNEMRRSHMEKVILFEKSEAETKAKCRSALDKAENLEKVIAKMERKEKEVSEAAEQQRSSTNQKVSTMETKVAGLQRENFQLKQQLTMETMKGDESRRKLQSELTETEMGAEKWIMDSQVLKDQLTLAQKQLNACQTELNAAKLDAIKYQEFRNKYEVALNSNQASASENAALEELVKKYENLFIKEQRTTHSLTQTLKKVQDENAILRSTIREEMILQEQISSLETQVKYMKEELKEKGACDAERIVLKEELKAWKFTSSKIDALCITPLSLEKAIRQLQNMLFEFKHENSDLKHSIENSTRTNTTLQAESVSLREQLRNLKEEKEKLTGDVKKMSRRLVLIVKDRDGLRELKESYEQEFEGMISEPLKERISQLQGIVQEYESILKEDALARKPCPECEQRKTLVETLQTQLNDTIREKDLLSQTLANQTTTCEDETTGVKIVAFGNNPSMLTVEARLQECLAENAALKEKVRKYEEDTLVGVTDEAVLQEKKKLEEQLRSLERKHEILTQAYDYETVQLQQACSKLFGFYVTLVREPQNQIRLQSIYSDCPDHIFIFQEAENSDMMLLETPILDHFRDDIERFLMGDASIPGFLASVTITYTQGLGQQLSNVSGEDEQNLTIVAAQGSYQPPSSSQHQSIPGSSEIQISLEGQDSSEEEGSEDVDEEEEEGSEDVEEEEEGSGGESEGSEPEEDDDDVVMID